MRILLSFFLGSLLFCSNRAIGQNCMTLGQNPSTAFPVCGTTTFLQNNVPPCGGRTIPGPCGSTPPLQDVNPFWYRFTCYTAGTLGFLITPINPLDDYDWQLFDITGHNPNDVYSDASLFVACNWSGSLGVTGASPAGSGLVNCAGNFPILSSMPTLIVDHEYLLLVSNFSTSQQGYNLNFTGGTASITNPNIPKLLSATANCDGTQIGIKLNKEVFCNTLTGNGSEFSISPAGAIATATGFGCNAAFSMDSITLTLANPLPAGTYTLAAIVGSDGNTLTDNCGLSVAVGNNVSFTLTAPPPLPMGTVGTVNCAPASITINFTDAISCSSIAADGSDFLVTGPSTVAVTAATVSCNANGETNSITLQFSSAITVNGNYQVTLTTGSDGNSLTGQCNRIVPVGSTADFTVQPQPPIPMGTVVQPGCSPASLVINFADPILCNSIAANGSDFSISGPAIATITGATATCNSAGETMSITIQLAAPLTTSGNYLLQAGSGSDGNTLLGQCLRSVTAGSSAPFIIPVVPIPALASIVETACAPTSVILVLDGPVKCSSIAADGTDFAVAGPDPVTVSGASAVNCINGLTDSISIQFSAPIVKGGTYQLQLMTGSDGNSLLNDCDRVVAASSLSFTASDTVSATFSYLISSDCLTDDVTFTHPGGNNINEWAWTVNGNAASDQQGFTQNFPAASQQAISLTVSNGVCTASASLTLTLNDKVVLDFTVPAFICPDDSVVFTNLSTGTVDNWSWDFGNGNTSTLQDPPGQTYPVSSSDVLYSITLSADNSLGCQGSISKTLKVLSTCLIAVPTAFTPNQDGLNDFLYPLNAFNTENLVFKVYNRWGQLLFLTKDWSRKWDGKYQGVPQPTGVYAWMLSYTDKSTGISYSQKGTTLLIR